MRLKIPFGQYGRGWKEGRKERKGRGETLGLGGGHFIGKMWIVVVGRRKRRSGPFLLTGHDWQRIGMWTMDTY